MTQRTLLLLLAGALLVSGCFRGQPRESRNITVIPDMEYQKKYKEQQYTEFFADHRTMRTPPEGTVARGWLNEDTAFHEAKVGTTLVVHSPVPLTMELMERGRDRYNVYCAPCHDRTGSGKGIVAEYGLVPPTNLHLPTSRAFTDGHIFDVISNGIRNMPGYRAQIPTEDRWAIVAYVRALQRSTNAQLADVPADVRNNLR